ncbi:MAG: rhamnulokinase [Anaerolineae bacterium]|jgi:rhamnulokinase|nr:rhamnulokinase [Anaerolineae bacterium]MDH7474781.1 rhamnulokinase family protein [Anaerolineae bacterium]
MPRPLGFLAFDLGAESGRAMLGQFDGERIQLSEVHRFPNGPVRLPDGLHWDVLHLWSEIKQGLTRAIQEHGANLVSIGLDTWGVDFGLLDRDGALISNPYHYRDSRTDGMLEEAFRRVSRAEIFEQTGIQFMQINSLYQLLSMVVHQAPALDIAETFLTMPDLFNYWLTGRKVCEFSNATTTQCYDPRQGRWAIPLLERLSIPTRIFPEIVPPGTVLGELLPSVAEEVCPEWNQGSGASGPLVIAPACHDTGSAVAAVPAEGSHFAYISSGTWSLMGAEVTEPVINASSLGNNFTNEGGVARTFRLLKNIMGLWLVQECRRTWANQGDSLSYYELMRMAAEAEPLRSIVNPDDSDFLKPGDMPGRIRAFCERTGQPVPQSQGAVVRCALESLALKYRWVLERLEEILGRRLEPIHIVGGGAQNRLLNQLTADATGRQVVAGPIEATAAGNVLVQAMALGYIGSLEEGRRIVRRSFDVVTYEPAGRAEWDEAYSRFLAMV